MNENAKTLAVIIAILLIPFGVLAWNYYESQPNITDDAYIPEDIDFDDIDDGIVPEIEDDRNTDNIVGDFDNIRPTPTPEREWTKPEKPERPNDDKVDSIVDGGKVLPNTSSHPVE